MALPWLSEGELQPVMRTLHEPPARSGVSGERRCWLLQPGFGAHQSAATPNRRFMSTGHGREAKGTLHEPPARSGVSGERRCWLFQPGFGAHQSAATPNRRFMSTGHGCEAVGTSHEALYPIGWTADRGQTSATGAFRRQEIRQFKSVGRSARPLRFLRLLL